MKALKFTLILAVMIVSLSSCTEQDLNEDDLLITEEVQKEPYTGGNNRD